jgi:hypothetical protein
MALYSKVCGTSPDSLTASASSKMVKSMLESGKTASLRVSESRLGLMVASTMENGSQEDLVGKALRLTKMEASEEANGKMATLLCLVKYQSTRERITRMLLNLLMHRSLAFKCRLKKNTRQWSKCRKMSKNNPP